MQIPKLSTTTAIKVASLLVHADELAEQVNARLAHGVPLPAGAALDAATILTMLSDPAIKDWLGAFPPALLPVKR